MISREKDDESNGLDCRYIVIRTAARSGAPVPGRAARSQILKGEP